MTYDGLDGFRIFGFGLGHHSFTCILDGFRAFYTILTSHRVISIYLGGFTSQSILVVPIVETLHSLLHRYLIRTLWDMGELARVEVECLKDLAASRFLKDSITNHS